MLFVELGRKVMEKMDYSLKFDRRCGRSFIHPPILNGSNDAGKNGQSRCYVFRRIFPKVYENVPRHAVQVIWANCPHFLGKHGLL